MEVKGNGNGNGNGNGKQTCELLNWLLRRRCALNPARRLVANATVGSGSARLRDVLPSATRRQLRADADGPSPLFGGHGNSLQP